MAFEMISYSTIKYVDLQNIASDFIKLFPVYNQKKIGVLLKLF